MFDQWHPPSKQKRDKYPKFVKGACQFMYDYHDMSEGECVKFIFLMFRIDVSKATVHNWIHSNRDGTNKRVY
jgi:hypothetical protein